MVRWAQHWLKFFDDYRFALGLEQLLEPLRCQRELRLGEGALVECGSRRLLAMALNALAVDRAQAGHVTHDGIAFHSLLPYLMFEDDNMREFPESLVTPEEMMAGVTSPDNGLCVGTYQTASIFERQSGPIIGADVAALTAAEDWLRTGQVRRWYHFTETAEVAALDRPRALTLREHVAPGPALWGAAASEAPALIAGGLLHALVSTIPFAHFHYVLREAQDAHNVPCIGMLHVVPEEDAAWLGFVWGETQPWDVLFAPTVCGARAFRAGVERLQARLGRELYRGHVEVIPYGVTMAPVTHVRTRWPAGDVVFLSLARFDARRKFDAAPLLLAFAEVARTHPRARLVLAGTATDQRYPEKVTALVRELGLTKRVELWPDVSHDEKASLLAEADVFIAFSDNIQETYGIAVVEAMAAGLAVIAADWNGFKESVVDGVTGVLLPTTMLAHEPLIETMAGARHNLRSYAFQHDATVIDLPATVSAMRSLADDPEKRRAFAAAGRKRAEEKYDRVRNHRAMGERVLAAVHEARARPVVPAPRVIDWRAVFGHYPSAMADGSARVSVGSTPLSAATGELARQLGVADRQQLRTLLAATVEAVSGGEIALGALSATLATKLPTLTPAACARWIVHFAKYGFVSVG